MSIYHQLAAQQLKKQTEAKQNTPASSTPNSQNVPATPTQNTPPTVYYRRTPDGIEYENKTLIVKSEPTIVNGAPVNQITFTTVPKAVPASNLALDTAIEQTSIHQRFEADAAYRQGTSPTGMSIEAITHNLSPQQKAEYNAYQQQQAISKVASGGSFFVTILTAPLTGPMLIPRALTAATLKTVAQQAALGAGLNVGFSQIAKTAQGGGLLTPTELVIAGGSGAVLAPLGAKVNSVLGLTGRSAMQVAGRVGVGAVTGGAVNAGVEYIETGTVTPVNVAVGVATGAVFTGAGEVAGRVNAKYNVAGKVQSKAQEAALTQRNLAKLEVINDKYVAAYETNTIYQPSLSEKLVMKATGVGPLKPKPQIIESPTVPTANPSSYETYMTPKEVTRSVIAYDRKGVPVDQFTVKDTEFVPAIREKPTDILSYQSMVEGQLKQRVKTSTDLMDSGTVLVGKSQPPEVYYAKHKPSNKNILPEYDARGGLDPNGKLYAASFEDGGATVKVKEPTLGFKKSPLELRTEQLQARSNALRDLTNNADLFPKVSPTDMPTSEASAITASRRNVKAQSAQEVMAELNSKWLTEESNIASKPVNNMSNRESAITQELTAGNRAEPTGVEKTVSDIQSNRLANTARQRSSDLRVSNPFVYSGKKYYQTSQKVEEEAYEVYSYPNSGLKQPSDNGLKQPERNSNVGFVGGLGLGVIPGVEQSVIGLGSTPNIKSTPAIVGVTAPNVGLDRSLGLSDIQPTGLIPSVNNIYDQLAGGGQDVREIVTPITIQPTQPLPITPPTQQPIESATTITTLPSTLSPMFSLPYLPEFKYEGGGFSSPNTFGSRRKRKAIRFYPVVDPENVFAEFF